MVPSLRKDFLSYFAFAWLYNGAKFFDYLG